MILRGLQVLTFLLTMTLEVSVHAHEIVSLPNQKSPEQLPENCLLQKGRCAFGTSDGAKFKAKVGEAVIVLDANTSVIRATDNSLTLVSGIVWIKAPNVFKVETEYGTIETKSAEFWVSKIDGKILVQAIKNDLRLTPRGGSTPIGLDAGEENWFGTVQKNGVASAGSPRAIYFPDHLVRWARLFPGTKGEFESAVGELRKTCDLAAERVANYDQGLAERRLASLRSGEDHRRAEHEKIEARNRQFRELYRLKILDQ